MVNPFSWLLRKTRSKNKKKQKIEELKKEEQKIVDGIVQTLQEIPLLSSLSKIKLRELAGQFQLREYGPGDELMVEGAPGDEFYLIQTGSADVLKLNEEGEEVKIAELKEFDYCGDQALIKEGTRNATVRANSALEVLVLNRQQFGELKEGQGVFFVQRKAVAADICLYAAEDPVENTDITVEQKSFIKEAISKNLLFANLEEEIVDAVLPYFFPQSFEMNDAIIEEGETNADQFYVIESGECLVHNEKNGDLCTLTEGYAFGELALLYNAPRNATIRATSENVVCFVMARNAYQYVVTSGHQAKDERNFTWLRSVKLFQSLLANELTLIDMELKEEIFEANQVIFNQDDAAEKFYIVKQGACEGEKRDGDNVEAFVQSEGSFFGELALLSNDPRQATITAGAEGCTLLTLAEEEFRTLLGPLEDIMSRNADEYKKNINDRNLIWDDASKICDLDELQTIGLLGRGAFGKVTLVVDPTSKKSYALKAIKKVQIEELGQSSHIVNEKKVMHMMDSRFLVNLRRTYKDDWRVYFLVDVCLGGELFTILRKKRSFNEDETRFYVGCVVEAFDYMHGLDIIYRDLKPENLVMSSNGYIKVTDFGFAKIVPKKTYTLCGTPDYLAPEIVTGQGHGKPVDWWCLGVLIYELLSSFPPFFDDEPMGTYRKIIQGKYKFPKYFTSEARDLIARLLRTKPTKRLAVMKGGADNIRNHTWYKGFDWLSVRAGEFPAPFVPEVKSTDDISNFDQRDKRASAVETGRPPKTPWDRVF